MIFDIFPWLWWLSYPALVVILIICLRSKIHRIKWLTFALVLVVYEIVTPKIGNSKFVQDREIAYDINHFQHTASSIGPNPLSNYQAEQAIISATHPVSYQLLSTGPYDLGYQSSDPDMFIAEILLNGKKYDLVFTDPLEPLSWSPFRTYQLVVVQPVL